jgi:23S rRNA (guanosine2251-2'-O)-methyltransferase
MALQLRNPHSVLAALETRPQDVLQITAPPDSSHEAWSKVLQLARAKGVKIQSGGGGGAGSKPSRSSSRPNLRQEESLQSAGRLGAAEAQVKERSGITAEELFRGARDRAQGKGLWLALDSLTDPQNVGAIFRAAAFFGVQGIILTQERSAPLTAAVYDVACGGMEYVPFTIQTNLQRAFEVAKEEGLWILGTSEHAKQSFRNIERDRPWLLVVGNEEKGMRRLTEEACDVVCQIPPAGKVTSLNVSVATGIMIAGLTE